MTTSQTLEWLRRYESRNVTFAESDGSWPIVWEKASGVYVWDADGKKYLDLTAAFGVAAAGHANPRVVRAGQKQMARLLHAMGDVHPHELKARLARELSGLTFERWGDESKVQSPKSKVQKGESKVSSLKSKVGGDESRVQSPKSKVGGGKTIFCNSGFEAVEAALKTAVLATGKAGVIAFCGGYHGLGYGALNATHREHFRGPFRSQLREFGHFVPFPVTDEELGEVTEKIERLFRKKEIGAVLVEPVQVRGGVNVPPRGFLPILRRLCNERGALLILDEIYTGFGRTGKWFACEHYRVAPDIIALGKALTGGFPLSACVGRSELMDAAWPASTGEAIHTSTFLGHPVGCAMALAQIEEIERGDLLQRSSRLGTLLLGLLRSEISAGDFETSIRGLGLLVGLELRAADGSTATAESLRVIKRMLQRGYILLPEGAHGNVISFTPPLTITEKQLKDVVQRLKEVLGPSNGS